MKKARTYTFVTLLYLVANVNGQNDTQPHDAVTALAEQAAKEFDILAPSVRKAARQLLQEADAHNRRVGESFQLSWDVEEGKFRGVVKEGRDVVELLPTAEEYTIIGRSQRFSYRVKEIDKILRTGRRNRPFVASVIIEVNWVERKAQARKVMPIKLPKNSRFATQKDRDALGTELELRPKAVINEVEIVRDLYPLPYAKASSQELLPVIVRQSTQSLKRLCEAATPKLVSTNVTIDFEYRLKERRWILQRVEPAASVFEDAK